jgi:early secretory antigenic target protein ESAT-6
MGYDGLLVNHGQLDQATQDIASAVKAIDNRMNQLESELNPLQSDWAGNAQAAYADAKRKWDTAIGEMMQLLNETGTTVGQSNQDYHSADMRGANSFQIG